MGQYYKIVNITKKQYLTPWPLDSGAKLLEFCGGGTSYPLMCLGILLADGNNRGGGDLRSDNEIIGSWAGDQIVIAGDYADEGKFVSDKEKELFANEDSDGEANLYSVISADDSEYEDITEKAFDALNEDHSVNDDLLIRIAKGYFHGTHPSNITNKLVEAKKGNLTDQLINKKDNTLRDIRKALEDALLQDGLTLETIKDAKPLAINIMRKLEGRLGISSIREVS